MQMFNSCIVWNFIRFYDSFIVFVNGGKKIFLIYNSQSTCLIQNVYSIKSSFQFAGFCQDKQQQNVITYDYTS